MKLALCLYKYFPYGGLQRDFLRIAEECVSRGHQVTTYTLAWEGVQPDWLDVVIAPISALSGIKRYQKFSQWLVSRLQQYPVDMVMGFNKMPGLDVYYCADPCFEHKSRHLRSWWYRFTARYRHFSRYEQAVFNPGQTTDILMISEVQQALFKRYYKTEGARMCMLPPGINRNRCVPENAAEIRHLAVSFTNGSTVRLSPRHRIAGIPAGKLKPGDRLGINTVADVVPFGNVSRSFDLLTDDPGYRIQGIPVNSMIEEMANAAFPAASPR